MSITVEIKKDDEKKDEISNYQKKISDFFQTVPSYEEENLKDCHFAIISMSMGFSRFYDFHLLNMIMYFRKRGLFFADIIEVVKRNVGGYENLTNTELNKIFEPAEVFIQQATDIKNIREDFVKKNKSLIFAEVLKKITKK